MPDILSSMKLWNRIKAFFGRKEQQVPAPILTPAAPSLCITIKANDKVIGAVQSLSVTETRDNPIIKIEAHRVRFSRERVEEAFQKGANGAVLINGANQKAPLQIDLGTKDMVSCSLHNLKVTSTDYSYQTDDWIIVDSLDMTTEDVDKKS